MAGKLIKQRGVEVDLAPLHEFNRALSGDVIWTTREGRRIPVKEMATQHLINAIKMLKGESPIGTKYRCDDLTRHNWIEIMSKQLYDRQLGDLTL